MPVSSSNLVRSSSSIAARSSSWFGLPVVVIGLIGDKFDQTRCVWQHISSSESEWMGPCHAEDCKQGRPKPFHSRQFAANPAKTRKGAKVFGQTASQGRSRAESSRQGIGAGGCGAHVRKPPLTRQNRASGGKGRRSITRRSGANQPLMQNLIKIVDTSDAEIMLNPIAWPADRRAAHCIPKTGWPRGRRLPRKRAGPNRPFRRAS
jgi:hypothetical protein